MYLIISNILISLMTTIVTIYMSSKIMNCDINYKNIKCYFIIFINTILLITIQKILINTPLKAIYILFINYLCIKILFKQTNNKTLITSIFIILINFISEIIFTFAFTLLSKNIHNIILTSFVSNIIILLISIIITSIFNKKINKWIEIFIQNNEIEFPIYTLLIILFSICVATNNTKYSIFTNILSIICLVYITTALIMEKLKYKKMKIKNDYIYDQFEIYNALLDRYRKINHENKNDLVMIKNMIKNKNYNNALNYISEVLQEKEETINITSLKNIKSETLKGFLQYKFSDIKNKNIKVNFDINKDVSKINIDEAIPSNRVKDLYRIIGIILDNAIEATLDSEKKIINININLDDDKYIINISNTFNKNINLESLGNMGYTTKGNGRGVGLSLVNEILNQSTQFELERQIVQNIFYCELKIKIDVENK